MQLTLDQAEKSCEIVSEWNAMRDKGRPRATPHEVIEYLITQEKIGIAEMKGEEDKAA